MLRQWDQGIDILGGVTHRVPWIYVSGDRGTLDTDKTLRRLGMEDWNMPCYAYEEVTSEGEHSLFKVAETFPDAQLIVIEGLQAFIPESPKQSQNKATLTWMTEVRRKILNKGKTIIATVHSPKQEYANNRNNFLGSASLAGATSTLINVTHAPTNAEGVNNRVRHVRVGGRNFPDLFMTYELDSSGMFVEMENTPTPVSDSEAEKAGLEPPSYHALDGSIAVMSAGAKFPMEHFFQAAKHAGVSNATMYRWLEKRVDAGLVVKVARGLYERPTAQ